MRQVRVITDSGNGLWPRGFRHGFFMLSRGMQNGETHGACCSWCREQFGYSFGKESRWYEFAGSFYFREDDDAFAFRMRWC